MELGFTLRRKGINVSQNLKEYQMEYVLNHKLVNFIEDFFGKYDFELTKSTLIENDLGITGEDGHDLIMEYSKLFKVNISEFIFSKYFYPEPSLFVEYGKIEPLTLGDLEEGILNGFLK